MLRELSKKFIYQFCEQFKIEPALIYAIGKKESNLQLTDKNGQLISRFEKWVYRGFKQVKDGKRLRLSSLPGILPEWIKSHSDDELVKISASWGIFQIMGYYYPEMGYSNISDLIEDWLVEEICVKKSLEFMIRYRGGEFLKALQNKDFHRIALYWNGAGFTKNNYDKDIEKYYNEIKQKLQ